MILLIDGYNVIKQKLGKSYVSDDERESFISMLGRYAKKRQHDIILCFDGGDSMYPFNEKMHGITINYSGYNESADCVIKELLKKYKNKDTLLVSSDRELKDYAKINNVESIDSSFFYSRVTEKLSGNVFKKVSGEVQKLDSENNDEELDQLMEQASRMILDKDAVSDTSHIAVRHKPRKSFTKSRSQLKRDKKIEKL